MLRLAFLFAILLLGGCQTVSSGAKGSGGNSPSYERVTVTDKAAAVDDCTFLTAVAVEPPLPLLAQSYPELTVMTRQDYLNQLRRATLLEGGDTVLRTGTEDGKLLGKTYDCGADG